MDSPLMTPDHTLADFSTGTTDSSKDTSGEQTQESPDSPDERVDSQASGNDDEATIPNTEPISLPDDVQIVEPDELPDSTLSQCDLCQPQSVDRTDFPVDLPGEIEQFTLDVCTPDIACYTVSYPIFHSDRGLGWEYFRYKVTNQYRGAGWHIRVSLVSCYSNPKRAFNSTTAHRERLTSFRWFSVDERDHATSYGQNPEGVISAGEAIEHLKGVISNNNPYPTYFGLEQIGDWVPTQITGNKVSWERYPGQWDNHDKAISDILTLRNSQDHSGESITYSWDISCEERISATVDNPPRDATLYTPPRDDTLDAVECIPALLKDPVEYDPDQLADIIRLYLAT